MGTELHSTRKHGDHRPLKQRGNHTPIYRPSVEAWQPQTASRDAGTMAVFGFFHSSTWKPGDHRPLTQRGNHGDQITSKQHMATTDHQE